MRAAGCAGVATRTLIDMSQFALNQFLYDTGAEATLAEYRRSPAAVLDRYDLTLEERQAVEQLDIARLYAAGVNPYRLRYFCLSMGITTDRFLAAFQTQPAER